MYVRVDIILSFLSVALLWRIRHPLYHPPIAQVGPLLIWADHKAGSAWRELYVFHQDLFLWIFEKKNVDKAWFSLKTARK